MAMISIDVTKVTAVLLSDGWHPCAGMTVDSFQFTDDSGNPYNSDSGFQLTDTNTSLIITGRLDSIWGVQGGS